jgi:hypothetical protein
MSMIENDILISPGNARVLSEMYLAIFDFNPLESEKDVTKERIKVLSYQTGDIVLMTIKPNRYGWFEGYRASDPARLCGISHVSTVKKINF